MSISDDRTEAVLQSRPPELVLPAPKYPAEVEALLDWLEPSAQVYVRCQQCGRYVGCFDAERSEDGVRPVAWLRRCEHVALIPHLTPSLLWETVTQELSARMVALEVQGPLAAA